jgi:signal transduction histidine kinase
MTVLAQIVASWPFALSIAAAAAVQGLRNGRRRTALNEALHELRRPLQAVALASGTTAAGGMEDPMDLAAAALERLDHEINGGSLEASVATIDARSLTQSAVARWQARAGLGDGSLELRWNAGAALVGGDRRALAQALDNLIVNAIEHGGPSIVVSARRRERWLRIAVVDSGRDSRSHRDRPAAVLARLSGRRRRGHGLTVVRRIASRHDGRFVLQRSGRGCTAVLELPLSDRVADIPA